MSLQSCHSYSTGLITSKEESTPSHLNTSSISIRTRTLNIVNIINIIANIKQYKEEQYKQEQQYQQDK